MPDAVYSEINFHITWHTKSNLPLITPNVESKLYSYIKHKIIETSEVYFHAVGGIEDHIHIVISPPPSLLISDWIGKLKAAVRMKSTVCQIINYCNGNAVTESSVSERRIRNGL